MAEVSIKKITVKELIEDSLKKKGMKKKDLCANMKVPAQNLQVLLRDRGNVTVGKLVAMLEAMDEQLIIRMKDGTEFQLVSNH